jgi:diaminohydroxyphosphoribosylaminopyrimidine deaminase/5-amino-6-(5-phosphoribosylamino)uracil reductase
MDARAILDNLGYFRDRLGFEETVTLKVAVSSDGMVARGPGRRDEVSGEAARRDAHALRALHDAVVVGVETARVDRPALDCRLLDPRPGVDPVPVVLDSTLRLPARNAWSDEGREFVVITTADADATRAHAIEAAGGRVVRCPTARGGVDVGAALDALRARGLSRVLVEGGPRVLASFFASDRWDALWVYRSPVVFGPGGVSFSGERGRETDAQTVGGDERRRFVNEARFDAVRERFDAMLGE